MSEKRNLPLDPRLLTRAREMRRDSAPAEQLVWTFLRDRQLGGYKFRRQTPLQTFIADFFCHELNLIVELDGETHLDRARQDRIRTEILQRDGHHVIRFWNNDVFENLSGVLEVIYEGCQRLANSTRPHPGPLPEGEGVGGAVEILRGGGVVAFPTETVYGLGADAINSRAVQRVFDVKGRPPTNPCIVHVADEEMAKRFAANWPVNAAKLVEIFWPGPLTIVLAKIDAIPSLVTAGKNTVGLRCPDHPLTLQLLREFGGPIIGPSANRSTHVSPTTAQHVRDELGDAIDLILDGGPCEVGIESTVLDLSGNVPTILRPGAISREQIESIVGSIQLFGGAIDPSIAATSPGQHKVHYAPITPTYRFETNGKQHVVTWSQNNPEKFAVVIGFEEMSISTNMKWIAMPNNSEEYARQLYAILHHADQQSTAAIWIEMPPDEPNWTAVRDRLLRASRDGADILR
jgi:L-threonylcarbamoyladenylate synthase